MSGHHAGRVALVTGSSTGIGRQLAEMLAAEGAAVLAHGIDPQQTRDVATEWRQRGWRCAESAANLIAPDGAELLFQDVTDNLGSPDILVLNASIECPQILDELTFDAMQKQLAINVISSCLLMQSCVTAMADRGWGRVIAIGSVQEERPNARHLFYAGTKVALSSMLLNLARHERHPGMTFNIVRPGAILTDRNRAALANPAFAQSVIDRIPVGRLGRPEDCSGIVSLLCSDAGSYINGAVIAVDGGMRV